MTRLLGVESPPCGRAPRCPLAGRRSTAPTVCTRLPTAVPTPARQPATCDVPTSKADLRERLGSSTAAAARSRGPPSGGPREAVCGSDLPSPADVSATRRLAQRMVEMRRARRPPGRRGWRVSRPRSARSSGRRGRTSRRRNSALEAPREACSGHAVCGGSHASINRRGFGRPGGDAHAGRCVSGRGREVPRLRSLRRGSGLGSGADEGRR